MLNGLDPIIIFNFKKNFLDPTFTPPKIPTSEPKSSFPLPAIPIYLSEDFSGIFIDTEDKSIDIDTTITPTQTGEGENTDQRVINSSVKITMKASKESLGVSLFSALTDLIIPKVTSKEYSITYLHGAVVIFNGILHSFSITQDSGTDLYTISLEISKPSSLKLSQPIVPNNPNASTLGDAPGTVKK
jgi:hypothetical protein